MIPLIAAGIIFYMRYKDFSDKDIANAKEAARRELLSNGIKVSDITFRREGASELRGYATDSGGDAVTILCEAVKVSGEKEYVWECKQ